MLLDLMLRFSCLHGRHRMGRRRLVDLPFHVRHVRIGGHGDER